MFAFFIAPWVLLAHSRSFDLLFISHIMNLSISFVLLSIFIGFFSATQQQETQLVLLLLLGSSSTFHIRLTELEDPTGTRLVDV